MALRATVDQHNKRYTRFLAHLSIFLNHNQVYALEFLDIVE
ncbi:hypothetical protein [Providencia rettgeri]|nr:hypothetical protein [Providencia rettgeri]